MIAIVLDPGRPATLEPLTCTRDLRDFPIANRPLVSWQHEVCEAAGFCREDEAPLQPDELYVRGDAWVTVGDLLAVADAGAGAVLTDAANQALAWIGRADTPPADGRPVKAEQSFRIVYPWDLLRANEAVLACLTNDRIEGEVSPAAKVEGRLVLGPGSRLLPGVFIEGHVVIGAQAKIGPNCYLRGGTTIGDRCHVGNAVELKNTILLPGASVGHLSYVGDSILGEKVNFGAGTITANLRHDNRNHRAMVNGKLVDTGRRKYGVVAGDHVHTGIHTSLYPGRALWPHTSTLPGAIVREDVRA